MLRICAWCKAPLGERAPYQNKDITWSICDDCIKKIRPTPQVTEEEKRSLWNQAGEED